MVTRMRQHITWTACACTLIIWAGTQTWAFQDEADAPVGLAGILAAYAPDGLAAEDFEELSESIDETWKEWVTETGELVTNFYEGDNNTVEAQRSALKKLQAKLNTMNKALADKRYASIHDDIEGLYLQLSQEVDFATAILDTLTTDKEAALKARTASAEKALNSALAKLRGEMNRVNGGDAWLKWAKSSELSSFSATDEAQVEVASQVLAKLQKRESYSDEVKKFVSKPAFLALEDALSSLTNELKAAKEVDESVLREEFIGLMDALADYQDEPSRDHVVALNAQLSAIQSTAPDGGLAISAAFRKHYRNYNLRVAVTEGLMNRIVGDVRRETSGVNEFAMGARIVGNQTADLKLKVDVQPSKDRARFDIKLDGVVSTNTNAYVTQATIRTVGRHGVSATKPVTFDGTRFFTEPARVSVNANNQPVAARTRYSGGLFGRMADNIAMQEAYDQRGQANAYTRRSITQELSTELNSEVDSRFSNASMELQNKLYGPLREYGLYPDAMALSSTSNEILLRTQLANDDEVAGGLTSPAATPPQNGFIAQVHESLLTNSMNRLELGTEGKMEMTEGQLREILEERLSKILDREVSLGEENGEGNEDGNTFVFDQENPIRFTIADGEIVISLRAGLKRESDDIPTQIITVPLVPTMKDGKVLINRGNVGVKPVKRPSSVAEQVARANVMRQKIQSALPEKELDASFVLEHEDRKIDMTVDSISAKDGWLTITLK